MVKPKKRQFNLELIFTDEAVADLLSHLINSVNSFVKAAENADFDYEEIDQHTILSAIEAYHALALTSLLSPVDSEKAHHKQVNEIMAQFRKIESNFTEA